MGIVLTLTSDSSIDEELGGIGEIMITSKYSETEDHAP